MAERSASVGTTVGLLAPNVILYGPPGVGKSEVGERLARQLERPFVDTDERVETQSGRSIPEIFAEDGEAGFRRLERDVCQELARRAGLVIACGGGALLDGATRAALEASGSVICLRASEAELRGRLRKGNGRPLLEEPADGRLGELLAERKGVYDSFPTQLDTTGLSLVEVVKRAERLALAQERWQLEVDQGDGYEIWMGRDTWPDLRSWLEEDSRSPCAVVTDDVVGPLHARELARRWSATLIEVPHGEGAKNLGELERIQAELVAAGMDRSGTLLAVGGGVVTDLAGFAAATFMRGIRWVAVPTTLLGMVDAAIGGKVGVDLPAGKNLVGAFHPPTLVLGDFTALATLADSEWGNGMAELIKAAIIGDADLFRWMEEGVAGPTSRWVRRAQKVKVSVVEKDPLEAGARETLNAGHTVAHALEATVGYRIPHGEAVSLGLIAEAQMAEQLGMAPEGWHLRVAEVLARFRLPTAGRGWDTDEVIRAMEADKKARGGIPRFAIPVAPGRVDHGLRVPAEVVRAGVDSIKDGT